MGLSPWRGQVGVGSPPEETNAWLQSREKGIGDNRYLAGAGHPPGGLGPSSRDERFIYWIRILDIPQVFGERVERGVLLSAVDY